MEPMNDATRKLQLEMAIDMMKADGHLIGQFQAEAAKMAFTYFTSLVAAGFNEFQALEIVKTHGVNPKVPGQ